MKEISRDPARFAASPIGDLLPIFGTDGRGQTYEHVAFAAHPLTAPPELGTATWNRVARASRALGRLQQGSLVVINPGLLRQPTFRREAQSTSALEGTYAPLEDVLAADVMQGSSRSAALNEVLNYVTAAENGFHWVQQQRPLTSATFTERSSRAQPQTLIKRGACDAFRSSSVAAGGGSPMRDSYRCLQGQLSTLACRT